MTKEAQRFVPGLIPAADPTHASTWLAFRGDQLLVQIPSPDDRGTAVTLPVALGLSVPHVRAQYLGTWEGAPAWSAELSAEVEAPEGHGFLTLRQLFGRVDLETWELAGLAFQIQHWDRTHQYCSACGTAVEPKTGERVKKCPACGTEFYPRLAPCAIVLVTDGPRVLLTRAPHFPKGMYGLVAGFLEPGETLEQCAAREVLEETGLRIDDVRYVGSQPWPFPHQIMVGFTARYAGGDLVVDHHELEEAAWFDRAALPQLPPRLSIARRLIDEWIGQAP